MNQNTYQEVLLSALQSRIDRRGEDLASLEAFRAGFKALQRHDKRRECDDDLREMKLQQIIDKRLFATIKSQQHYIEYLEDVACEEYKEVE